MKHRIVSLSILMALLLAIAAPVVPVSAQEYIWVYAHSVNGNAVACTNAPGEVNFQADGKTLDPYNPRKLDFPVSYYLGSGKRSNLWGSSFSLSCVNSPLPVGNYRVWARTDIGIYWSNEIKVDGKPLQPMFPLTGG